MPRYTEDDILQAIQDVLNGISVKRASTKWGIPRSTLQLRILGGETHKKAAENQQKLSKSQGNHLANWILSQEALGTPLIHTQIKDFAQRLLAFKGDDLKLGKHWMQTFISRNPILKTKKARNIDSQRVNGATTEIIKLWFKKLVLPEIQAIKPENRWNMDEAGIMEGLGVNELVVGSSQKHGIQKKQPGSRAWTSFIECISALGVALDPLVIFKGKSVQQQWFSTEIDQFEGWQFTATDNGWTTDATAIEWLKKVFLPQTATEEDRLLILDGHGSHESTDFMWICYQNNIRLLFLPPHSSHVLQPLDLGVFSSLKGYYRRELSNLALLTDSSPVGKRNFLLCYHKARLEALVEKNIQSGWRATGL
jgi:hypothetical protein